MSAGPSEGLSLRILSRPCLRPSGGCRSSHRDAAHAAQRVVHRVVDRAVHHVVPRWALLTLVALLVALLGPPLCDPTARAALLQVRGPAGAAVLVDGRAEGVLPLGGPLVLTAGAHAVRLEQVGFYPSETQVDAISDAQVIDLAMGLYPKSRSGAVTRSLVLAGVGQQYEGHDKLGWTLMAAEVAGVGTAVMAQLRFFNQRDEFDSAVDRYNRALNPEEIAAGQAAAQKAFDRMGTAETVRNIALGVALATVTVSVLDAWLRFPHVEAGSGDLPLAASEAASSGVHLALQARF